MTTQVVVELDSVTGAQLQVIKCLQSLGLRCVKYDQKSLPTGQRILALEADGESHEEDEIRHVLAALECVRQITRVANGPANGQAVEVAEPSPSSLALNLTVEERFKNKDSEAGDPDVRDRMLVFGLLSRYPNLTGRIMEIKSAVPAEFQLARLGEIGYKFGLALFANLKIGGGVSDSRTAIRGLLIPAIEPLAHVHEDDGSIVVSRYRKKLVRKVPLPTHCRFLLGLLQGLVDAAPDLPPHTITKTHCLTEDDHQCRYALEAG